MTMTMTITMTVMKMQIEKRQRNFFFPILPHFECKCDLQCEELISACFVL